MNRKRGEGRGKDGGMGGEGKVGDFQKFAILTASMLCSANLHHRAKFRACRSSRSGVMAVYRFFKMAAVHHLRFLKVRNFNCLYPFGEPMCVRSFVRYCGQGSSLL